MNRKLPASIAVLVVAIALAVGLFGRFYTLGARTLATDEYYFVRSVGLILERDFPIFASGGWYLRALASQYLMAASVSLFGETGFAFRLTPVLWSLGSVGLAYVYCRRYLATWAAAAVAVALMVSSWHIEFARFARMYSAFQFTTLLFLIAVDRAYFNDNPRGRYLPHLAFLVMTLTHEMAVLLAPLLFVPLLGARRRSWFPTPLRLTRFILAGLSAATVSYCLPKLSNLGLQGRYPENYVPPDVGTIVLRVAEFPFWSVSDDPGWNLTLLCSLLAATALTLVALKNRGAPVAETDIVASMMFVSTAAHSFALSALSLFVLIFRCRISRIDLHPKRVYWLLGASLALGVGWLGYAASVGRTSLGEIRRIFLGWPDLIEPLLRPAGAEFPLLASLIFAATIYQLAANARRPWLELIRNPAVLLLYVAICVGVFHRPLVTLRYVYFVYPVMLCTVALTVADLLTRLEPLRRRVGPLGLDYLAFAVFLALFGLSADFNPSHIANIGSERVGYRMEAFDQHKSTWYLRRDFQSPAQFLNDLALPDRSLIIVGNAVPVDYYLERDFVVYHPRDGLLFRNSSRARGTLERWSNRPLISTLDELRDRTAAARQVWVVRPTDLWASFDVRRVWGERLVSQSMVFSSRDGRIEVIEVLLSD